MRARLEALAAAELGADELALLTVTYEIEDRVRSYELIAEAFGLPRVVGDAAEAAASR